MLIGGGVSYDFCGECGELNRRGIKYLSNKVSARTSGPYKVQSTSQRKFRHARVDPYKKVQGTKLVDCAVEGVVFKVDACFRKVGHLRECEARPTGVAGSTPLCASFALRLSSLY